MEFVNDINKQSKKREIVDRLDELENLQKQQMEMVEQGMKLFESKLTNLDSLYQYMEIVLEIVTCNAEKGSMQAGQFHKEQESDGWKRMWEQEHAEKEYLSRELTIQQATVEQLRIVFQKKQEETMEMDREFAEQKIKIKDLDGELIAERLAAEEQNKQLLAVKGKIQELNENLVSENRKQQKMVLLINKLKSVKQELDEKLTIKTGEAQNLSEQLKLKQEQAECLNNEKSELKQTIEKGEELFRKKSRELEKLKVSEQNLHQALIQEENKVKMFEKKFGCWKAEIKDYQELLELVFECESLADLMGDYKLIKSNGSEDVANLIHFVSLLGDRASFLPTMYDYLENYKEKKREAVSQAEINLFACLNSYYTKNYEISGDLIRYPQEGAKFEQESMKDFDNRRKMFRSVECVYVPAVMRDEKTYLKLALVKGVM